MVAGKCYLLSFWDNTCSIGSLEYSQTLGFAQMALQPFPCVVQPSPGGRRLPWPIRYNHTQMVAHLTMQILLLYMPKASCLLNVKIFLKKHAEQI